MNKAFKQGPLLNLEDNLKVRAKYKLIIYFLDSKKSVTSKANVVAMLLNTNWNISNVN